MRDVPYVAGLVVAGSMRQDEGSAAEWAAARVCSLREVQAAGQDHKEMRRDRYHPAYVPATTKETNGQTVPFSSQCLYKLCLHLFNLCVY